MSAGYSGTPLAKKLGIKPDQVVVLRHAPAGWRIPDPPAGVRVMARPDLADADLVLGFYRARAELEPEVAGLTGQLRSTSAWWVAWPRRAAGHRSDLTENGLREVLLPTGLVDVKVATIDQDWSGLKFVWRREHR